MKTNRLLTVLAALVLLAVAALYFITRPKPMSVGLQPGAINYPMMHALDGGYFASKGLKPEVKIFTSANDAQDALLGNSIFLDAVIPIQNIAAIEAERPGTLGMLAVLISDKQHPLDFLVVPASSPITDAKQLNGKTIVVFPGTFSETLTKLALQKIGVTEVKFLKLPPPDMPQALRSGQADAGVVYEPTATLAETGKWGRVLARGFWEEHLLPVIVVGGYTYNAAAAKKNPELVSRSYQALKSALADAKANPVLAKNVLTKYLKLPPDIAAKMPDTRVELSDQTNPVSIQEILIFLSQERHHHEGCGFGTASLSPLTTKREFHAREGTLHSPPNFHLVRTGEPSLRGFELGVSERLRHSNHGQQWYGKDDAVGNHGLPSSSNVGRCSAWRNIRSSSAIQLQSTAL